jgi:hypothetical protein
MQEEALSKMSHKHAPWFIIPSNHKWFRNPAVATIVVETLESLGMEFPEPTVNIDEIASQIPLRGARTREENREVRMKRLYKRRSPLILEANKRENCFERRGS